MIEKSHTRLRRRPFPRRRSEPVLTPAIEHLDFLPTTPRPAPAGDPPTGDDNVSSIMTTDFAWVPLDLSVEALTELLLRRELDAAVVLDHDELVGVVSTAEPMNGCHVLHLAHATVEEIMAPLALSVWADTSIHHAAALMAYEGVAQLPVVSPRRGLVGVVTSRDVARWVGRPLA